jgi:hypothetical protein
MFVKGDEMKGILMLFSIVIEASSIKEGKKGNG